MRTKDWRMDKTGDISIRSNEWQRLLRWHRRQKVKDEGEDGVNKDEGKRSSNLGQKLKVK